MPEHILLYVVFLSQVILISFYLPRKMLRSGSGNLNRGISGIAA